MNSALRSRFTFSFSRSQLILTALLIGVGLSVLIYAYSAPLFLLKWEGSAVTINRPLQGQAKVLGVLGISLGLVILAARAFVSTRWKEFRISSCGIFCLAMAARSGIGIIHNVPFDLWNLLLWSTAFFVALSQPRYPSRSSYAIGTSCKNSLLIIALVTCLFNAYLLVFFGGVNSTMHSGRLLGSFGHPNFAGQALASCSVILLEPLVSRTKQSGLGNSTHFQGMILTFLLALAFFLSVYLTFATGSRTANLSLVLGIFVVLFVSASMRTHLLVIVSIFLFIALFFGEFNYFDFTSLAGSRSLSFKDTRSESWLSLFDIFLSNPVLGDPTKTSFSESSPLWLAASFGISGILIYFVPILVIIAKLRYASRLGIWRRALTYSPALVFVIFLGSLFEGVIAKDTFSLPLFFMFVFLYSLDSAVDRALFDRRNFTKNFA